MRIIELLGVFLARVFRKIEKGDLEGAERDIQEISKETTGLPLAVLQSNQPEKLIELFSSSFGPDHCRVMAAATLLDVSGEMKAKQGNETSAYLDWIKALELFLCSAGSPDDEIKKQSDKGIEALEKKLIHFDLPHEIHRKLAVYSEGLNRFSLAENHWFESCLDPQERNLIMQEFYLRITKLPETTLLKGGLTLSEITTSLSEIES